MDEIEGREMNILERAAKIPEGSGHVADMFGPEGIVEDYSISQKRANICLKCPRNNTGVTLTSPLVPMIKKFLEWKWKRDLTVVGEENLGSCDVCGCELKLQVLVPQKRIVEYLTEDERTKSPFHCWKLDKV